MALIGKQADSFGKDAQDAWDAGDPVFTPMINYSLSGSVHHGAYVAQAIRSIIAVGWRLDGWSTAPHGEKVIVALPLFVRP